MIILFKLALLLYQIALVIAVIIFAVIFLAVAYVAVDDEELARERRMREGT